MNTRAIDLATSIGRAPVRTKNRPVSRVVTSARAMRITTSSGHTPARAMTLPPTHLQHARACAGHTPCETQSWTARAPSQRA